MAAERPGEHLLVRTAKTRVVEVTDLRQHAQRNATPRSSSGRAGRAAARGPRTSGCSSSRGAPKMREHGDCVQRAEEAQALPTAAAGAF